MSTVPRAAARHAAPIGARAPAHDPLDRRVPIVCAVYALVTFLFFVVWNHFLAERGADEAIFENLLWNATHGNGLATWLESEDGRLFPHLALHFSPVILLLVPLYALFPSMHVVHLVVCVATALSGWMVHRLARSRLDSGTSFLVMGAFLLNPTIVLQTFLEFHEQALAVLPLLVLVAAYRSGSLATSAVAALFLLGAREDNLFAVILIGVLALVVRRDVRIAALLVGIGLAWVVLYRLVAIAWLGGGVTAGVFGGTYGQWGDTPGEAVRSMLADPARVVRHVLAPTGLVYLAQLLAPFLGVLGFGDPLVLAMAPQLLLILLAEHGSRMYQVRLHYSLVPVTLLTVGAIGTLARAGAATLGLGGRRIRWARLLAGAMFAAGVAAIPVWMTRAVQRLNPYAAETRAVMALVPDTASVTAPGYMINHMARRRRIGITWVGPYTVNEYVILEEPRRLFFDGVSQDVPYSPEAARVLRAAGYVEIFDRDGWHVWRRSPGRGP